MRWVRRPIVTDVRLFPRSCSAAEESGSATFVSSATAAEIASPILGHDDDDGRRRTTTDDDEHDYDEDEDDREAMLHAH